MKIATLLPPLPYANDSQDTQIVGGIAASKKPVTLNPLFLLPNALGYRKIDTFSNSWPIFPKPLTTANV